MVEDLALEPSDTQITFSAEARYAHQARELEIELRAPSLEIRADVDALAEDFHAEHEQLFAVRDPDSEVELIHWYGCVRSRFRDRELPLCSWQRKSADKELRCPASATKSSRRT